MPARFRARNWKADRRTGTGSRAQLAGGLPTEFRVIFVLRAVAGFTSPEVAELLAAHGGPAASGWTCRGCARGVSPGALLAGVAADSRDECPITKSVFLVKKPQFSNGLQAVQRNAARMRACSAAKCVRKYNRQRLLFDTLV